MSELKNITARIMNKIVLVEADEETITSNKVVLSKENIEAKIVSLQAELNKYQSLLEVANSVKPTAE